MNKAKTIAVTALCCAVATGCMLLAALPAVRWTVLFLGVIASVAVVIPMMVNAKNLVYSLLAYLAASIFGVFFGISNIVCVAPIVTFSMPFAIVKVCGEMVKVTAEVKNAEVLEDPFGTGDDRKVVNVQVQKKPRLRRWLKWLLYYLLLEAGIGITLLATWLLTPQMFQILVQNTWFYVALGVLQLIVYPYDMLMTGCLVATAKVLRRAAK